MIHAHTGTQGLVNVSAPAVFPSRTFLSIRPGVSIGLGMELATAQVQLLPSSADGIAN